jgi:putative aldouronate transport system substrate-binding protein
MNMDISPRNSDAGNRGHYYWYGAPMGNLMIVRAPIKNVGPDNEMAKLLVMHNNTASIPTYMGFVFDQEPVLNEMAACASVIIEYTTTLREGTLPSEEAVESLVAEFNDKLKANGLQKISDEVQRQIDEWKS